MEQNLFLFSFFLYFFLSILFYIQRFLSQTIQEQVQEKQNNKILEYECKKNEEEKELIHHRVVAQVSHQ
jgi:Na+-transporting methylmalonyl-CoA/oxaloacetate decarboxylase gamma subunit